MISTGADQRAYQMTMEQGGDLKGYAASPRRVLFAERGTELRISPLLEGIRSLSGEKIQWYLAAELRDRIRNAKVRVTVIDKLARKQYEVEPRAYEGRLLHQLPPVRTSFGDTYAEIYLSEPAASCRVALARAGTRVIEDISTLSGLEHAPWSSGYVQGLLDVPFLNLTPGTRSGVIHDERYAALVEAIRPLEARLNESSKPSSGPKRNRPVNSRCERSSGHFVRRFWRCLPRSTTGLTFKPGRAGKWYGAPIRSARRQWIQCRRGDDRTGGCRACPTTLAGSDISSITLDLFSASSYHRQQVR